MEEINYAGLLREMVRGLVDEPDAIEITADEPNDQGIVVYHLHVAADDMGRVIGKQGKIANALRAIMRAVANRRDDMVQGDID